MANRAAPARPTLRRPPPRRPPGAPAAPPLPWGAHVVPGLTLVVLAVALYVPALDGPFVYDDPNSISQSNLIRSLTPLTQFFALSTRPLSDFSFAINFAIGGLNTRSFHLTSMLLHAINAVLLYFIALRILGLPSLAAR